MNKNTKARVAAFRKRGEHKTGKGNPCVTSNTRPGSKRKPRDADRRLLALGQKRALDKRITGGRFIGLSIYA